MTLPFNLYEMLAAEKFDWNGRVNKKPLSLTKLPPRPLKSSEIVSFNWFYWILGVLGGR